MINLILFGPPGAGKGTQAQFLVAKYNLTHISTVDILRAAIAEGTPLGVQAKSYMDKGQLVPDEMVIGIIQEFIHAHRSSKGFIFDGFPRTRPQAVQLDKMLHDEGTMINAVLLLTVEKNELVRRLLQRAKLEGRADDKEEVIENRIKIYHEQTAPVASHYNGSGKLFQIDGLGSVDEISARLQKVIDSLQFV